jgi:hypothetical protein
VYEEDRLRDTDIEHAEGPQADQTELGILEGDRIPGTPLEIREDLHIREYDLGAQWARESPGQAQHLRQDREVCGLQGVPPRTERVVGPSLIEEDGDLALTDRELCAEFDLPGALLGYAVDDLPSR